MSCVSPDGVVVSTASGAAAKASPLAQFADGLHAMAQPLTILRGALGALQISGSVVPKDRRYVEMSVVQVDRVCEMLSSLRSLLDAAQFEAICSVQDWHEMVQSALDDCEGSFQRSGVRLTVTRSDLSMAVMADPERMEQALRAALEVARAFASEGGEIECRILPNELGLQIKHGKPSAMTSAVRLALSVLETAIDSQHGTCRFTEDPFSLAIALPTADSNITSDCRQAVV